jgi:hypothetical protein
MAELSQKEITLLGLQREEIEQIASSSGLERKQELNKIIRRFTEALEDEARTIDDGLKRKDALAAVSERVRAAKKYIVQQTKGTAGKNRRTEDAAYQTMFGPVLNMNIYNRGQLVDGAYLMKTKINGRIEIRNPDFEFPESDYVKGLLEGTDTPEAVKHNIELIIETLGDMSGDTKFVKIGRNFPIREFLGAIDVSRKNNRVEVYNFWEEVGRKYEQFKDDLAGFFLAVKEVDFEGEVKTKFDKLYNDIDNINLEYIVEFPHIEERGLYLNAMHQFFNLVGATLALEGHLKLGEEGSFNEDDDDIRGPGGDVNAELLQYLETSLASSSSTAGDTIDAAEWAERLSVEEVWDHDGLDDLLEAGDPLLVYEYNKGEKLLAINDKMERKLRDVLEELEDILDEGDGVTLDTQTDIENWMDQLNDTTTISANSMRYCLPIAVLSNVNFNKIYPENEFPSASENKPIGVDNLEVIKDFFNDLYSILSGKAFRAELDVRSSKGRGRGSVVDRRDLRGVKNKKIFGTTKIPISLNEKGSLRSELMPFKTALQKMLDSAIEYFFDPLYSGMLAIEMPRFASSIGSKVMQTLSLDLGLESVMSASYNTFFEGSVEEVDSGDLKAIADFMDNIFMPAVEINTAMIVDAEQCADALTEIFGREENNDDYCAALLHYFMLETEQLKFENKEFPKRSGKTIKERAQQFIEAFKGRKAFPIFALPHWLDMNQGVLTKNTTLKNQYNRLKDIFESVQTDLPVMLHKLLKAHDAVREQLGKDVIYGFIPLTDYGIEKMINKMQVDENIDLSTLEVENIVKAVDSHENISKEYGISSEQVYMIKANFR